MVNAISNSSPITPAKKAEEKKTEAQSPSPAPAPAPNTGNTGSKDTTLLDKANVLDPKVTFKVSQKIQQDKAPENNDSDKNSNIAQSLGDMMGGSHDAGKTTDTDKKTGTGGDGGKPEPEPEKMTTRRALDILMKNGNEGLNKLDVARDKIDKGKDDPKADKKVSTDDLDAAIKKDGYLTDEQKEAAKHLRDSGAWDEINGKDKKATFEEIINYRNTRTSPDKSDGQRPVGTGQDKVHSDGKIGAFEQGSTGDCWWLSSINAVNNTEEGKKDIKDAIKQNDDGSYSVNFKGDKSHKTYTVTEEMIEKNKNSKGDDDVKILEEAARQYFNDNPTDSDGENPLQNGGQMTNGVRLLTGKESESTSGSPLDTLDTGRDTAQKKDNIDRDGKVSSKDLKAADTLNLNDDEKQAASDFLKSKAWDDINGKDDKATVEEIVDYRKNSDDSKTNKIIDTLLGDKYKDNYKSNRELIDKFKDSNGKGMMTFAAPGKDSAKPGAAQNGHAFTVLNIDGDTVTYTNPWDSDKKRTMSVDDLLKADDIQYASF